MTKMTKLNIAMALAAGAVISLPAQAAIVSLGSLGTGPVQVKVNVLDKGTTTYGTTALPCTTVAACDDVAAGGDGTMGGNGSSGWAGTSEDSWGVFTVTQIDVGGNTWLSGIGGQYLSGMFYGIEDKSVSLDIGADLTAGTADDVYTSAGTGGFMDIYIWNSPRATNPPSTTPGERTAFDGYDGSGSPGDTTDDFTGTAANLWLRLAFDEFQSIFSLTGPTTAQANTSGFLSVIDGMELIAYDTDTVPNNIPGLSDFSLSGAPLCTTNPTTGETSCADWTTQGNMTADGFRAVPEPSILALLGLGLIGLGIARRRVA